MGRSAGVALCCFVLLFSSLALAQTAASPGEPVVPAEPVVAVPAPPVVLTPSVAPAPAPTPPPGITALTTKNGFKLSFDGYLTAGFTTSTAGRFFFIPTKDDNESVRDPNVGRNDGFGIDDARINLRASYKERLYARIGLDASVVRYTDANSPSGEVTVGVKNAYLSFKFHNLATLWAGRFKPPFDMESLTPVFEQYFVRRALESRGVVRNEGIGNDLHGFDQGYQVGMMLSGSQALSRRQSLEYALAVTNGSKATMSLNDNDLPAVYARMSLTTGKEENGDEEGPATQNNKKTEGLYSVLGIGGFYNRVSSGNAPDKISDDVGAASFDATVNWRMFHFRGHRWMFRFRGQVIYQLTDRDIGNVKEHALGGHAQLSVNIIPMWDDLFLSYRYAYYDPRFRRTGGTGTSEDFARVMHHTVGLRYAPSNWPIIMLLDYTRSLEEGGRSIPNDIVALAGQVLFR